MNLPFGFELVKKAYKNEPMTTIDNQLFKNLLQYAGFGMPLSDITKLDDTVNKGYLYNHILYSVINKITNSCAGVPWAYYEERTKGAKSRYNRAIMFKDLDTAIYTKQTQFEQVENNDVSRFLNKPNNYQQLNDLITDLIAFYLITGNGYWYGIRRMGGDNRVIESHTAPAHLISIIFGTYFNPIKGYRLSGYINDDIAPENIMHIKNFNPDYTETGNWLYGLSPIQAAAKLVTLSNHGLDSQINSFNNQGARGILTGEKEPELSVEQAKAVQDKWKEKKGSSKAGDIIVSGTPLKWTQIGFSPVDMQIIESQKMTLRDICRIYNVPPQVLGDSESSTYNNMKEARKALITDASLPCMEKVKSGMNRFILTEKDKGFIDYDLQAFIELQDDLNQIATTLNAMNWLTLNEKRVKSNVPEIDLPIMNEVMIPMGSIPASEFNNESNIVDPSLNDDQL